MYKTESKNKLSEEKSPYLIQHAENPVNWFPWNKEAFENAKNQDKPIFLSIGYSTCHWCHVMAHESFEDQAVADILNDVFIPIKVDREERPEIDNIYMTVCQMMTGSGGWPLTIFMTPDKKPFYAATYIPKTSCYGRIGLIELIPRIDEQWKNDRDKLLNSANRITDLLKVDDIDTNKAKILNSNIFNEAYIELKQNLDNKFGGFGKEPKFPMPHQNLFLLNYFIHKSSDTALSIVEKNLQHMKAGGIYDHLGYGFHRYSTDSKWLLPHFEKMLYDQALLIYLYTTAYQITKKEIYKITVKEIIEYIQKKMTTEEGAFCSAEDADSEGVEGKFYVWETEEIYNILEEGSHSILDLYNINENSNFDDESTGQNTGKNILHLDQNNEQELINLFSLEQKLIDERRALYNAREKRVHPHKDDKVLTDWNGLMIAALARAAFVFEEDKYLQLAENAVHFIKDKLKGDNYLLHRYREGDSAIKGTIDDYAFFTWGLLELYQTTFKIEYLNFSMELNNYILENFWDNKNGGFFIVSKNNNELLFRNKEVYDGAIPSGNSIALWNLIRISHLTADYQLAERASDMIKAFSEKIKVAPTAYCQFLIGLQSLLLTYYDLIIVGNKDDEVTKKILNFIRENYNPNLSIIIVPPDKNTKMYRDIANSTEIIHNYKQIQGKTTIYICKDYNCNLPVTEPEEVFNIIKNR